MTANRRQVEQDRDDRLAFPMFCLSMLFLVMLASLIVLWVDIPRVAELAELEGQASDGLVKPVDQYGWFIFYGLLLLWPAFIIEYFLSRGRSPDGKWFPNGLLGSLVCLAPPLRLATPSPAWDDRIWLPVLNWQHPSRQLSRTLERWFSKPMIFIALLILPILLLEFVLKDLVEQHHSLRVLLHVATGFIWCAFTIEFIIMMGATEKKFAYLKSHWIDLAIILLPLISFLRTIRALRLAKLAKVQKLAKMSRVYRMRGVAMKGMKALMLIGFVNRLLRVTPEKTLKKLKSTYEEKAIELNELKTEIEELESQVKDSAKTDGSIPD